MMTEVANGSRGDLHGTRYLQAGVAKSGNYWLYRILQNVQEEAGMRRRSFIRDHPIYPIARKWELSYDDQAGIDVLDITPEGCFFRISSVFRRPIQDLGCYLHRTTHVWTHSPYVERSGTVLPRFDRIVYVVRDPRDVAVSMSRFVFTPYMQTFYPVRHADPNEYLRRTYETHLSHWARHVTGYMARARDHDIHFVFFERLLEDFEREFSRLLDYLGVQLDSGAQGRIHDRVTFSSMKAEEPDHVRRGTWGGWKDALDTTQKRLARRRLGPLLERLGYPLRGPEVGMRLPAFTGDVSETDARRWTRRARPPALRLWDVGRHLPIVGEFLP